MEDKYEKIKEKLEESNGYLIIMKEDNDYSIIVSDLDSTEVIGLTTIGQKIIFDDMFKNRSNKSKDLVED